MRIKKILNKHVKLIRGNIPQEESVTEVVSDLINKALKQKPRWTIEENYIRIKEIMDIQEHLEFQKLSDEQRQYCIYQILDYMEEQRINRTCPFLVLKRKS